MPLRKGQKITRPRKVVMLENGEMSVSRKDDPIKWWAQNRVRLNAKRRAKAKNTRKKLRAQQRAHYAVHPECYNTPQQKLFRKLRRNGVPLVEARAIVAQSSTLTKEIHNGTKERNISAE